MDLFTYNKLDVCGLAAIVSLNMTQWAFVILEGKDATDEFEDAGHSKSARELMEKFCIGELDESSQAIPKLEIVSKTKAADISKKIVKLTKQYWAVPVGVVGLSVVVGFLYLRKKWAKYFSFWLGGEWEEVQDQQFDFPFFCYKFCYASKLN